MNLLFRLTILFLILLPLGVSASPCMHGPEGLKMQVMTSELIVEAQLEHPIPISDRHAVWDDAPGEFKLLPESKLNRPKSTFVVLNILKKSKGSELKLGDRSTFALSDDNLKFQRHNKYSEGVYLLFLKWHDLAKSWVPAQLCTAPVKRDPDGNATGFNMLVRKYGADTNTDKKFYTWEEARTLVLEEVASQARLWDSRRRKQVKNTIFKDLNLKNSDDLSAYIVVKKGGKDYARS